MPSSTGGAPDERIRVEIVRFLPRLRRFCIAIGGGIDAGEDLMQATVERALARSELWREGTRLDSWMYRIAQNLNIDAARSRRTRGVMVDLDSIADNLVTTPSVKLMMNSLPKNSVRRRYATSLVR